MSNHKQVLCLKKLIIASVVLLSISDNSIVRASEETSKIVDETEVTSTNLVVDTEENQNYVQDDLLNENSVLAETAQNPSPSSPIESNPLGNEPITPDSQRLIPQEQPTKPIAQNTQNNQPTTNIQWLGTRFNYYSSSSHTEKFLFEPTLRVRLSDLSFLDFRTGVNTFSEPRQNEVINVPLNVTWNKNITPEVRFEVGGGLDFFDQLPTAFNFNTGVTYRAAIERNEETKQLESFVDIGMSVNQSPYKVTAKALNNNITFWDVQPLRVLWQIDPNTEFRSSLGLRFYNDDNTSFNTNAQIRHKIGGIFDVGADVSTNSFDGDSPFYSTPYSVLSYGLILGVEGKIFEPLTCEAVAYLGQRSVDERDYDQQRYRVGCDYNVSSNVDLSLGYEYSENAREDTDFVSDSDRFIGRFLYKF